MSNGDPRSDPPDDDGRSHDRPPGDRRGDRRPAVDPEDERPTKYCVECGASINARAEICPECGVRQPGTSSSEEPRIVAAVLAIVLGTFGAHKFYLGETGIGVLYLCFSWTFIPTILGIVEGAIYLSKSDEQFREQYLEG